MNRKRIGSVLAVAVLLVGLLAITGCVGDDGAAGPAGPRGLQGEQGVAGDTGPQGTSGAQGEQGIAGTRGDWGETGAAGADGSPGADGAAGVAGDQGPRGLQGYSGGTGATGATGPQGEQGIPGDAGADGAIGPQGSSGALPPFSVQLVSQLESTSVYDAVEFPWEVVVHLTTVGPVGGASGDEARIVLTPLQPMTLGQVKTIAWSEYLVSGYQPHVDILLDTTGDSVQDDALVIEYAYNTTEGFVRPEGQPTYGSSLGVWYQTLSDDENGPAVVNDTAYAWLASGASGPAGGAFGVGNFWITTLGAWKSGLTATTLDGDVSIDANTLVTGIEIEVDNWIAQSEAYIDNITINGVAIPD